MSGLTRRSAMAAASPDGLAASPLAVDDPTPAAVPRRPVPLQLKAGLVIVVTIVLLGLLAPWIAPHPWDTISMRTRFLPPSATYWLGTDEYGRDVLSRLLMGTRLSLAMGVSATLVSLAFGVPIGLAAGYFRGRIDEVLMRSADVLMAIPPIMLGLLVLAVTPPSLWKTAVAVGFVYIPPIARVTRSVTLALANEDFIQAARARAESASYILFREILPNAWPPLIVEASLRVTYAILLGSALSFLGLGAQPPSSDWGLMISEARSFIDRAPWIALAPGFAMCLLVIGINLVGDGARERLDPRLKSRVGKG
jgi:peptide/nickel transport system permease protein